MKPRIQATLALLLSLYLAILAGGLLVLAWQSGPEAMDIWAWIILGVHVGAAVVLPVLLFRAWCQKRTIRMGKALPWAVRLMYLSVILAICDSWAAGTDRRDTLFSQTVWAMSDGGTRGYNGFGYCLTYHRRLGGEFGPEVWFWFTPFRLYYTSSRVGASWVWTPDQA
ncbi:MAG TPA: hypothetical protein VL527_12850 [Dongiaceae bacterium]|nr:hypothetical protein [Dongiaceae bacterium]